MPKSSGNLIGQRYGRLEVVDLIQSRTKQGNKEWECRCDCGNYTFKTTSHLRDKKVKEVSCGCSARDSIRKASQAAWEVTTKFRHPLKKKIKDLYRNMVSRCTDPDDHRYSDYGGRGIGVCQEWLNDRYTFYHWCVENEIQAHLQIDRRDNHGPYSPDNCKFSTRVEQANNTRKNVYIEFLGRKLSVTQWSREVGVRQSVLWKRMNSHPDWSAEQILTTPFRRSK